MDIRVDDLRGPEIRALLEDHLAEMHRHSPPESVHALDLDGLRKPGITFWTVWTGDALWTTLRASRCAANSRSGRPVALWTTLRASRCEANSRSGRPVALMGCGALKELDRAHGEVKSMRTAPAFRRQGVAKAMLAHIIREAGQRNYHRLSLETGSMEAFLPARELYESFGFSYCPPFGDYAADPNSVFLTRVLGRP
jgi:putative acetyltransferase